MIRVWINNTGVLSGLGASASFAVLSLQLMADAVVQVRPEFVERREAQDQMESQGANEASVARSGRLKGSRSNGEEGAEEESSSLRLTLSVLAGSERSEVFVNGRRLGASPYLGDYTCKRGESLRFEVVPKNGPLIVRHAVCQGTAVRIRD